MEQKKLIRFVESFIVLPLVSVTLPLGGLPPESPVQTVFGPQIALFQKKNTEVAGLLALNQAVEPKTNINEIRAKAIDAYFEARKMPLAGYGAKFVEVAEANDIDWRLLPAISVIETTGGKHLCKKIPQDKKWNPFGWGSCKIGFNSFNEAIETVGKNLGGNNPNTAHHYEDKTNKEILEKYNPPSVVPDYAKKVMKVMDIIGSADLGEEKPDTEV